MDDNFQNKNNTLYKVYHIKVQIHLHIWYSDGSNKPLIYMERVSKKMVLVTDFVLVPVIEEG